MAIIEVIHCPPDSGAVAAALYHNQPPLGTGLAPLKPESGIPKMILLLDLALFELDVKHVECVNVNP